MIVETVFALLLIADNKIIEHRIQDNLSQCLKGKRYAMRDKKSGDRVQYQCIKSKANIEIYMGEKKNNFINIRMIEKLMTLLVGILLALAGWTLTRTFDLSTNQAVQLDKVSKLERQVEKLEDQMDRMMNMDKEIMDQHEKLFKKLENSNTGYSYN